MSQDCRSCGAKPGEFHDERCLKLRNTVDRSGGVWFVYYSDYSGFAVFPTEIEALRYAVDHSMQCEFRQWGVLRGGG